MKKIIKKLMKSVIERRKTISREISEKNFLKTILAVLLLMVFQVAVGGVPQANKKAQATIEDKNISNDANRENEKDESLDPNKESEHKNIKLDKKTHNTKNKKKKHKKKQKSHKKKKHHHKLDEEKLKKKLEEKERKKENKIKSAELKNKVAMFNQSNDDEESDYESVNEED